MQEITLNTSNNENMFTLLPEDMLTGKYTMQLNGTPVFKITEDGKLEISENATTKDVAESIYKHWQAINKQ